MDKKDWIIFDDIVEALESYLFMNNKLQVTFDLRENKDRERKYFKILGSNEFPVDFTMVSYELTQEGINHLKSFGKKRLLEIIHPGYNMEKAIIKSDL